ncbi:MAG: hypothetical protein RIE31_04130 [Alphaproteobacteria bacterium]
MRTTLMAVLVLVLAWPAVMVRASDSDRGGPPPPIQYSDDDDVEDGDSTSSSDNQIIVNNRFLVVNSSRLGELGVNWLVLGDGVNSLSVPVSDGIDVDDQNRVDASGLPLLGGLFSSRFDADDVSLASRIGSAWFRNGTLLLALERESVDILSRPRVTVLNQDNALTFEGDLAPVTDDAESVTQLSDVPLLNDFALNSTLQIANGTSLLIGGLLAADEDAERAALPFLGGVPGLGSLFAGSVHTHKENRLIVFITPSIVAPEEQED